MDIKTALILSDIHYGDLAHLESFGKMGPASIEDLTQVAEGVINKLQLEQINIDYIFVLGDLTSRGSPGEFQDVDQFILILRTLLNLEQNKVFITYGNHDVDWKICSILSEPEEHAAAYCETAANIAGLFTSPGEFTHEGPVIGCGITHLDGIDLISLNSGIECYSDQAVKHGKLGTEQYNWVKDDLPSLLNEESSKVVILHHHLLPLPYAKPFHDITALEEGANTLELLGSYGIDLVLHGHRHQPIAYTTTQTHWLKPMSFFCAGSFGVSAKERAQGRLPNTFHTVDIKISSGKQSFEALVKSFELDSCGEWIDLIENNNEYPLNKQQWVGVVDAKQQALVEIEGIMEVASSVLPSSPAYKLPAYGKLPLSLRCLNYSELNNIFQEKAHSNGLQITGEYPKACMLTEDTDEE